MVSDQDLKVTVIGLGYIGLPTAAVIARTGASVLGVDVNESVVDTVNAGRIHIEEVGLDDLVSNVVARNNIFGASEDISYCVYGGSSTKQYSSGVRNIQFEDNVFKRGVNRKCAAFGAITSFDTSLPGNVWKNNVWEDGPAIPASN